MARMSRSEKELLELQKWATAARLLEGALGTGVQVADYFGRRKENARQRAWDTEVQAAQRAQWDRSAAADERQRAADEREAYEYDRAAGTRTQTEDLLSGLWAMTPQNVATEYPQFQQRARELPGGMQALLGWHKEYEPSPELRAAAGPEFSRYEGELPAELAPQGFPEALQRTPGNLQAYEALMSERAQADASRAQEQYYGAQSETEGWKTQEAQAKAVKAGLDVAPRVYVADARDPMQMRMNEMIESEWLDKADWWLKDPNRGSDPFPSAGDQAVSVLSQRNDALEFVIGMEAQKGKVDFGIVEPEGGMPWTDEMKSSAVTQIAGVLSRFRASTPNEPVDVGSIRNRAVQIFTQLYGLTPPGDDTGTLSPAAKRSLWEVKASVMQEEPAPSFGQRLESGGLGMLFSPRSEAAHEYAQIQAQNTPRELGADVLYELRGMLQSNWYTGPDSPQKRVFSMMEKGLPGLTREGVLKQLQGYDYLGAFQALESAGDEDVEVPGDGPAADVAVVAHELASKMLTPGTPQRQALELSAQRMGQDPIQAYLLVYQNAVELLVDHILWRHEKSHPIRKYGPSMRF